MTATEAPALECIGLCKNFGALSAVQNITFAVNRGKMLGVVGPNGAGKTTLFNLLSGHVPCNEGRIMLNGTDITTLPPHQRFGRGLARTFQIPQVMGSQTVLDNAMAGAVFSGQNGRIPLRYSRDVKESAERALATVGLLARCEQKSSTLTPYEKKLLMIASAIAGRTTILLLDEPFGGLSDDEIETMTVIIRQLNRAGTTIIIVEHVLRALFKLAAHVFVMQHGSRIFEGSPQDFLNDENVIASYLGKSKLARSHVPS